MKVTGDRAKMKIFQPGEKKRKKFKDYTQGPTEPL